MFFAENQKQAMMNALRHKYTSTNKKIDNENDR